MNESIKEIEFYEKCLVVKRKLFGDNHADIALLLKNIGICYKDLGDGIKAIEYHEKALEIRKILYGDWHNDVATSLWNIATAYYTLKDN